jgi:hypothetical protein
MQHSWATTLEIVDLFTEQSLKTNNGHQDWKTFFSLVSVQFAYMENLFSYDQGNEQKFLNDYATLISKSEKLRQDCHQIQLIAKRLDIRTRLFIFAHSLRTINTSLDLENKTEGYVLLRLNTVTKQIYGEFFDEYSSEEASERYSFYERTIANNKQWVIVLVSSNAVGGIKQAYPNYFADSTDFLKYLNVICFIKIKPTENIKRSFIIGEATN